MFPVPWGISGGLAAVFDLVRDHRIEAGAGPFGMGIGGAVRR